MLSKGQQWDWLGDPFWRMQTLVVLFTLRWSGWLSGSCGDRRRS